MLNLLNNGIPLASSIHGLALLSLLGACLSSAFAGDPQNPAGANSSLQLTMRDSIVDPSGLNFPTGPYGSAINGQTFQQEALVSFKNHQYASYFADGGVLCLARRKLPDGPWESIRFPDYRMAPHNDVHNVVTVGLCQADGTLHLAYDHHVNTLRYRRSVAGVALDPEKFAWTPELFGPTTSQLEPGHTIEAVTYPSFFPTPDGRLQLLYRTGSSGDGDWHLAEYAPVHGWKNLGMVLSGKGSYDTSDSRCAYPNSLRYGPDSRLHLTWCWRERPAGEPLDLRTNHDLCYAYSDDFGRTWKNNDGVEIGRLSPDDKDLPIAIDSPGIVVRNTRFRWGQMNTTTEFVDKQGRVHVLSWQNPPDAPAASNDKNTWRYFHYWGKAGEKWTETPLSFFGRKPQIAVDERGAAWAVFTKGTQLNYSDRPDAGGLLTIAMAQDAGTWADWKIVWQSARPFVGEPLLDNQRWKDTGVLSVYTQEKPASPGKPSALHVIDFQRQERN